MTRYEVTFNKAQTAFMRDEILAWISMQESDGRFRQLKDEDAAYLLAVADMLQLLAQTCGKQEGGFFMTEDTAYSLNCYVEFDIEDRAADPDAGISLEDLQDYSDQLEALMALAIQCRAPAA